MTTCHPYAAGLVVRRFAMKNATANITSEKIPKIKIDDPTGKSGEVAGEEQSAQSFGAVSQWVQAHQ